MITDAPADNSTPVGSGEVVGVTGRVVEGAVGAVASWVGGVTWARRRARDHSRQEEHNAPGDRHGDHGAMTLSLP